MHADYCLYSSLQVRLREIENHGSVPLTHFVTASQFANRYVSGFELLFIFLPLELISDLYFMD